MASTIQEHPDFDIPWCRSLLSSPDVTFIDNFPGGKGYKPSPGVSNSLFTRTLSAEGANAVRHFVMFTRPVNAIINPAAIAVAPSETPTEQCMLVSVGDGVDGKTGRAHGGFDALLFDHVLGRTASVSSGSKAPATATMTVDYKAPVDTPGVFLLRAWPVSVEGRKVWVAGVLEDGAGRVKAVGKALFIKERGDKL